MVSARSLAGDPRFAVSAVLKFERNQQGSLKPFPPTSEFRDGERRCAVSETRKAAATGELLMRSAEEIGRPGAT